jgi:hypothetical protein
MHQYLKLTMCFTAANIDVLVVSVVAVSVAIAEQQMMDTL